MRIHHFTIPAHDPELVARVLADLLGARVIPMPHPDGALFVYGGDPDGTVLEIWPAGMRIEGDGLGLTDHPLPSGWPHHALVTSDDCDPDRVVEVFEREGWRVKRAHNGPPGAGFDLIRGWIENHAQIEFGGPVMRAQYERAALTLNSLADSSNSAPHSEGTIHSTERGSFRGGVV